ncbi:MAG: DEAD/DEAH box helicase [Planctomycetota bacterium]
MNFRDFGLAEPFVRAVAAQGYSVPTPIQQQAIPVVLSGRDVVGIAQTGTGKTAAFALPLLHRLHSANPASGTAPRRGSPRPPRVLVLASTRELALQIRDSFADYGTSSGIRIAVIYGGVGQEPQTRALQSGVDILVATPGRLLDLMQQGHCSLDSIKVLVLDEADRMLDMGFFPAIRRILQKVPKARQTLMFSATMKPEIRELADSMLSDPVSITIEPKKKTTELVTQSVAIVPQKQKIRALVHLIHQLVPSRCIVFSRTKHGADRIVRQLTTAGLTAAAIHANKSQNKRQRILEQFRSSAPPVLVATDIAARGIDVDAVSHVFNFDMPTEEETYVHRIGRAGRAGTPGVAVSLCDPEERRMLRTIEKLIGFTIATQSLEGCELNTAPSTDPATSADASTDPRRQRPPRSRERAATPSPRSRSHASHDRPQETDADQPRRFRGHENRRRQEQLDRRRNGQQRQSADRPQSRQNSSHSTAAQNESGQRPPAKRSRPQGRSTPPRSTQSEHTPPSASHDFGDGIFHG